MRPVRRLIGVPVVLAVLVGVLLPASVTAADPVAFGTPKASSTYGVSVEFNQPVTLAAKPARVEVLVRTPGSAGPSVMEVDPPSRTGDTTLNFSLALADGHIVPNTTFTVQWRVTDPDGKTWLGPTVGETYADTRVEWKTLEGDIVRVHWYEGGDDFGRRALKIGDDAIAETSKLLGVTETEPIDFFIYADQDKFYDALGPSTRENVGGEAHADIRTMFALITPGEINDAWVGIVVPHELTHLVFDTATKNPYHEPPHWLNEGLAVYLSQGYQSSDRDLVEAAARDGTIIPLEGLVGAFPTTRDRFFLAYAESVSAVDSIVASYGRDALIGLIRSYADGVSDDEAFKSALGVDTAAFQKAWLDSVGAVAPVRHGPQPAPVGPLPDGWSGAAPAASLQPGATARPTSQTASPVESPSASGGLSLPVLLGLVAVGLLVVAAAIVIVDRRRRSTAVAQASTMPPQWAEPPPPISAGAPPDVPAQEPPGTAAPEASDRAWSGLPRVDDEPPAEDSATESRPPSPPEP